MAELEPLYTAEEMRAAEAGHDVDAMMQRAGAAVAEELMRRFPDARRIALHAGGGANGGDGRIAAQILRAQGRELVDESPDVVIDALLGTGLKGEPRDETARLIEGINGGGVPVLAVDIPSGVNASTGRVAGDDRSRGALCPGCFPRRRGLRRDRGARPVAAYARDSRARGRQAAAGAGVRVGRARERTRTRSRPRTRRRGEVARPPPAR